MMDLLLSLFLGGAVDGQGEMQDVVGDGLLHAAADRLQIVEHLVDVAGNAGGIVDGGGGQTGVLRHAPDLSDLVDVVPHPHGVQGQLAQHGKVPLRRQRLVGRWALTVQQAVPCLLYTSRCV